MKKKIMKWCNLLIKRAFFTLVVFGCVNQIYAEDGNAIPQMEIVWQKELSIDVNMICLPGPVAFNKMIRRLLVSAVSCSPQDYSDGKIWLMEINPDNGTITKNSFVKDIDENKGAAVFSSTSIRSMTITGNNDVILSDKFDNLTDEQVLIKMRQDGLLEHIEFNDKKEKNNRVMNSSCPSGEGVLLAGRDKKRDENLVMKLDSEGNKLWEKYYRVGQGNPGRFVDVLAVKNEGEFFTIGWYLTGKLFDQPKPKVVDFILLHNSDGDVIAKEEFEGAALGGLGNLHQMCQEKNSGNIMVVYADHIDGTYDEIKIRSFAPDLKFLWEKQVVTSEENKPSTFNIATKPNNGFVVAANIDFGDLRVYEYDKDGNQVASFSTDKKVGSGNLDVLCTDEKAFVVFPTRLGSEGISKIKIIALELK
ncbi:MAG: hypothetical protein JXB29_07950 [Sedimentisphaerales bacterium]|nr:hypothetical protein [Sedimentisphaerales bacterium]